MATQIVCDKCETVVKPENAYKLTVKDFNADLCMNCAAEIQDAVETNG